LKECREDKYLLETYYGSERAATLRDGLHLQNGFRWVDRGKPILRLRRGGSVPRNRRRKKSCSGRKIKPPAKRQRLAEAGDSEHEVKANGLAENDNTGLVAHNDRRLDKRLSDEWVAQAGSEDGRIFLAGEAQPIRGREELDLNSFIFRINVGEMGAVGGRGYI